ncbi:hypothetical protein ACYATP_04925 [Lactobacillaceae bacterium Melli_B4]
MKMNQLLTTALVTIAGLGLTSVTANAASWQKGTPPVFEKTSQWVSSYQKIKPYKFQKKTIHYQRTFTPFSKKYGFNPTNVFYDQNKKSVTSGADESAGAAVNPHYRSLGKGWYQETSGAITKHNALKYELDSKVNFKDFGSTILIKVHNQHSVSIWVYAKNDGTGKKTYAGKFSPATSKDVKGVFD